MKTKNKVIALLEIAVVLCSVFLVAIPAIAAEQNQAMQKVSASTSEVTTASEDDYVLGVCGNANEDDTIDMRDLTYVKLIFFGKKPETELADAKYDGKVNPLDFIQIKLIIVGKEKELTVVDPLDIIATINKPIERIVILNSYSGEALKVLGSIDKVVGVIDPVLKKTYYYPELSDTPSVGDGFANYDYELIATLAPDLVITYPKDVLMHEEKLKLFGITVVGMETLNMEILKPEIERLGYILDKEEKAKDYNNWCKRYEDKIKSLVEGLTEEVKPKVLLEYTAKLGESTIYVFGSSSQEHAFCTMAGGMNIAGDIEKTSQVEWEWVLAENPDVIIKETYPYIDEPDSWIEDIKNRPGAETITAVRDNRIYLCSWPLFRGLDSVVGLVFIAKVLHPEFNLNPEDIHREFFNKCLNMEYPDVIFLYIPPAS